MTNKEGFTMKRCYMCKKVFLNEVLKKRAGRDYCPMCLAKDDALFTQATTPVEEPEDYESDTGNTGLEITG